MIQIVLPQEFLSGWRSKLKAQKVQDSAFHFYYLQYDVIMAFTHPHDKVYVGRLKMDSANKLKPRKFKYLGRSISKWEKSRRQLDNFALWKISLIWKN